MDHRLVRDGYIRGVSHEALSLYLFLVTVSDAEGLSYYSDGSVEGHLCMDAVMLGRSRRELCSAGLIAYRRPLYQVLGLDKPPLSPSVALGSARLRRSDDAVSIKDVFAEIAGGAQ